MNLLISAPLSFVFLFFFFPFDYFLDAATSQFAPDMVQRILVGNKSDEEIGRQVTKDQGSKVGCMNLSRSVSYKDLWDFVQKLLNL